MCVCINFIHIYKTILKLNGIDDSGKKPEVLAKFIDLIKLQTIPKRAMAQAFAKEQVQATLKAQKEAIREAKDLYNIIQARKTTQSAPISLDTFKDRLPKRGPAVTKRAVIPSTVKPRQPVEFIPLEEALPQFQSKNIKISKKHFKPKPKVRQAPAAPAPAAPAPTPAAFSAGPIDYTPSTPFVFNRKLFRNNKPSVLKPNYKYEHRFSERAGDYPEDQILRWVADENSDDYLNDKEKNAKRYAINKIMNAKNERNKSLYGIWVINNEKYDNVKKKWEGE